MQKGGGKRHSQCNGSEQKKGRIKYILEQQKGTPIYTQVMTKGRVVIRPRSGQDPPPKKNQKEHLGIKDPNFYRG